MIVWPDERQLTPIELENLARFRSTGGALALDAEPNRWVIQSWPRLPDGPFRTILFGEGGEQATLTIEENGIWNLSRRDIR